LSAVNVARSISLEIYVLKGGRWQIHSNYAVKDRDQCIDDAKELDASRKFEAVCVVRETYSAEKNAAREAVIYHSPTLKSPPPVAIVTEGGEMKTERPAPAPKGGQPDGNWKKEKEQPKPATGKKPAGKKPPPNKKKSSGEDANLAEVLPRLAAVCLVALGGASLVSYLSSMLIKYLPNFGLELSLGISQTVLITIFILSFLFFFIPLMRRFVPALRTGSGRAARPAAQAPRAAPPPAMPRPMIAAEDDEDETDSSEDAAEEPEDEPAEEPEDEAEPAKATQPQTERSASGSGGGTSNAAAVSADMLMFIGDSLEPLAKAGHQLNAFNRFGLTLFFSGAGEYLASQKRLSETEIQDILCQHMQMLGHTPDMARGFCANIEEYLVNPKYFQMYESGRSAMARHSKSPSAELGVTEAVDKWNEPEAVAQKNAKEFVAVLFTDIVGSTAMTQARGDDGAQLVVREHNTIVRDALALYGGREIKHTGDGIMATFPQIVGAVEGAVAIQQACQRANAANPDLGLGICIGINAGEPIHEDGDIFGTPVQMAARVLSKAEGEEIAVSNLVREMASGKSFSFKKKGDYDLKGFAEPVPIFLVQWKQGMHAPGEAA
jgi:adenylate cyclase